MATNTVTPIRPAISPLQDAYNIFRALKALSEPGCEQHVNPEMQAIAVNAMASRGILLTSNALAAVGAPGMSAIEDPADEQGVAA